MIYIIYLICIILAYSFGSVPSSVWIGKLFYNKDVREFGSKNAGATNTFRVLGKKAGIPVLLFDILKGWLAVKLAYLAFSNGSPSDETYTNLKLLLGFVAVIGHIFPVYVGFRGGKGVATLMGVVLAINPYAALISMVLFVVVWLSTNYISLASMCGAILYPITIIIYYKFQIPSLVFFSIAVAVLVLITHQKNIERLLSGTEGKMRLIKKHEQNKEVTEFDVPDKL
ncbi:MAG: glycerol-3-phosphate 1-O-acyltransferase PlsY [Bacteroidia bacterium]|nr:glycerol-3-phosphate 1-O-acyltransferase PlsY [Bacteroidia bacterium]